VPPTPAATADPTANYRRRARRLRWRYRGDSSRLMHALRDLAHVAPRPAAELKDPHLRPLRERAGAVVFTTAVEEALHSCDGALRYSKRLELIREADRLGVLRFEANLIIAVCQNRHPAPPVSRGSIQRWFPTLACIALVQLTILWTAWRLLH
jgi:hypothetical protein